MKHCCQFVFAMLSLLICLQSAQAGVTVPNVFTDNMVLQRGMAVPVWGSASPGETVTVAFANQKKQAVASEAGRWMVRLDPMKANSSPQAMTISGNNTIDLQNILVGDVWLFSGDFGVYFEMFKVINAEQEMAAAAYPEIRLLNVTSRSSNEPVHDIEGQWVPCVPENVSAFSALAYYFGRKMHKTLDVPVGLIAASYRYSFPRSWMSPKSIRGSDQLTAFATKLDSWDSTTDVGRAAHRKVIEQTEAWLVEAQQAFKEGRPIPKQPTLPAPKPAVDNNYLSLGELCNLYHGMIHPLIPYAIKGIVWSQGENGGRLTTELVTGWREAWNQPSLPFYFELVPKIGKPSAQPSASSWRHTQREQQMQILALPETGMAVTYDVSDYGNEPRNRLDPGERFARVALAKLFDKDVVYRGPQFKEQRVERDRIIIAFDHVGSGLVVGDKQIFTPLKQLPADQLRGFAIAGDDKKWQWATATIEGNTVIVHSDKVANPVAVRYAFESYPEGNLYSREGLPAVPFRTDAW